MKKKIVLLLILTAVFMVVTGCSAPEPQVDVAATVAAVESEAAAAVSAAEAAAGDTEAALADAEAALAAAEAAAGENEAALADAEAAAAAAQAEVAAALAEAEAAKAAQEEAEAALAVAQTPTTEELEAAESGEGDVVMIQGRPLIEFYVDTCGGCHGAFREGDARPGLDS